MSFNRSFFSDGLNNKQQQQQKRTKIYNSLQRSQSEYVNALEKFPVGHQKCRSFADLRTIFELFCPQICTRYGKQQQEGARGREMVEIAHVVHLMNAEELRK